MTTKEALNCAAFCSSWQLIALMTLVDLSSVLLCDTKKVLFKSGSGSGQISLPKSRQVQLQQDLK